MQRGGPVLLVIEDNNTLRNALCRYLAQRFPLRLVEAANAAEGLDMARRWEPEVMLVDLSLPDRPGVAVIPMLKAARPSASLIAMTSHLQQEHARTAALLGARACLPKEALVSQLEPVLWQTLASGSLGWSARFAHWRRVVQTQVVARAQRQVADVVTSVKRGLRWADREIWPDQPRVRVLYLANVLMVALAAMLRLQPVP